MLTLDERLNKISSKLEKVVDIMNDIAGEVMSLEDHYDLYDFSADHLEGWRGLFSEVERRMDHSLQHFDQFAFDGDSVREIDEEETHDIGGEG